MSIITDLTRMWLTRSAKPFLFQNEYDQQLPFSQCEGLGLYVHIPFCRELCGFCPYCKVQYDRAVCDRYLDRLIQEIHLVGGQLPGRKRVTSLYFGGGTPALAAGRLKEVMEASRRILSSPRASGWSCTRRMWCPPSCAFCGMRG